MNAAQGPYAVRRRTGEGVGDVVDLEHGDHEQAEDYVHDTGRAARQARTPRVHEARRRRLRHLHTVHRTSLAYATGVESKERFESGPSGRGLGMPESLVNSSGTLGWAYHSGEAGAEHFRETFGRIAARERNREGVPEGGRHGARDQRVVHGLRRERRRRTVRQVRAHIIWLQKQVKYTYYL